MDFSSPDANVILQNVVTDRSIIMVKVEVTEVVISNPRNYSWNENYSGRMDLDFNKVCIPKDEVVPNHNRNNFVLNVWIPFLSNISFISSLFNVEKNYVWNIHLIQDAKLISKLNVV